MHTVARARGGVGPPWGFTVIPLVGDTFFVMQPQVTLTSGVAHTCAAPGAAPGGDINKKNMSLSPALHSHGSFSVPRRMDALRARLLGARWGQGGAGRRSAPHFTLVSCVPSS